MNMLINYYNVLEINKNATPEEIEKAYRQWALVYHPDKGNFDNAHELFTELNEAFQVLSDPVKRAQYDQLHDRYFAENNASEVVEVEANWEEVVRNWTEEGKRQAEAYAHVPYQEFIKADTCYFNANLKANGRPYSYNLHKTTGVSGHTYPARTIRFLYMSVPIPRSKQSFWLHQLGMFIKLGSIIAFVYFGVLSNLLFTQSGLPNFWLFLGNILTGSLAGGIICHLIYYLTHTRSRFYYARRHPMIQKYFKKGYITGIHAIMSTTPLALFYYPAKILL